jgi:pimeloyl-ACP methyl ester carboxylesterase
VTTIDEQRLALETAIPQVDIRLLKGSSHYLHLERPDDFIGLIEEWSKSWAPARHSW